MEFHGLFVPARASNGSRTPQVVLNPQNEEKYDEEKLRLDINELRIPPGGRMYLLLNDVLVFHKDVEVSTPTVVHCTRKESSCRI